MLEARERTDERAVGALRPQAHVDPEEKTVGGPGLQQIGERLGDLGEEFAVGERAGLPVLPAVSLAFIEIDEVDVGGEVELLSAELAQAQHAETGGPVEFLIPRFAVAAGPLLQGQAGTFAQAEFAETCQLLDGDGRGREAVHVAVGDAQGHLAPPAAQPAQIDLVAGHLLARGGGEGAPLVPQRLVAEVGVAILRLL